MPSKNNQRCNDARIAEEGLQVDESNSITWNKSHSEYPRNYSWPRKAYDTGAILLYELFTTVISTTGPSAAEPARREYNIGPVAALAAFSFAYNAGQALGSLLLPPYSESIGRRKLFIYSAAVYSIASLITGVVPSIAGAVVGRFIAGAASTVPSVVAAGYIEDLYNYKHRVWVVLAWQSSATLGLSIGPTYGSFIASLVGW